jgi:hypothetical protein
MADIEGGFDFEAIDVSLPDLGEMLNGAADELLNQSIDFLPFDGKGDGGSQMATGTKVRVVLGPHIFDLEDSSHKIYKKLQGIDKSNIEQYVTEMIDNL